MNKAHLLCIAVVFFGGSAVTGEDDAAKDEFKDIPYTVTEQWALAQSPFGSGAAIVIDPKNRNEKDLKALGEVLRTKHVQDKNTHIFIYDNEKAAKMRKQVPEKGAAAKLYEKHLIGFYVKNSASKLHHCWFGITSKGVQGKTTEVKYELP